MNRTRISLLLGLTLTIACVEPAESADNDGDYVSALLPPDASSGTPTPTDAGFIAPVGPLDASAVVVADGGGGALDAGKDAAVMGPSAVAQITGSGKSCSTYGLPMNGKCGGIYCAIEPALLEAAFQELTNRPNGCNPVPSDLICSGITARTVAACARKLRSANPLATNAELRPKIQACAYEQAEVKAKMPATCLGCYLDSASCSGDKCLVECLGGDSPACDKCRLDKGCSRPVADCTGFPNPL